MDSSTYVESQTSPMEVPNNPKANFNDVSVNFGPTLWDQMVVVGDGAGGSEYVVGEPSHTIAFAPTLRSNV
jgi:hypothetical protein